MIILSYLADDVGHLNIYFPDLSICLLHGYTLCEALFPSHIVFYETV